MYNRFDADKIEQIIGYRFRDRTLLECAFTHASASVDSYDRLEYLGDAFLSYTVAKRLYQKYNFDASAMTVVRSRLVSMLPLSLVIEELGLHRYIICSDYKDVVEAKGKRDNKTKSDIFESLVGAILIDGGEDCAREFIDKFMPSLNNVGCIKDYRTQFKERFIDRGKLAIEYKFKHEGGLFCAEIYTSDKLLGRGKGRTKDEAKENACKEALLLND